MAALFLKEPFAAAFGKSKQLKWYVEVNYAIGKRFFCFYEKATDMYNGQHFSDYFAPNCRLQPMEIPPSCSTSLAFGPLHQICLDSSTTSYMAELTDSLPLRLWHWVPKTATISVSQMASHNGGAQILWQRSFMRQTERWSALLSVKTLVMWSGRRFVGFFFKVLLWRLPTS